MTTRWYGMMDSFFTTDERELKSREQLRCTVSDDILQLSPRAMSILPRRLLKAIPSNRNALSESPLPREHHAEEGGKASAVELQASIQHSACVLCFPLCTVRSTRRANEASHNLFQVIHDESISRTARRSPAIRYLVIRGASEDSDP